MSACSVNGRGLCTPYRLEVDACFFSYPSPRRLHEEENILRSGSSHIHDDIGVPLGDHGAPHSLPFQAHTLDEPPRIVLRRVLENRAGARIIQGLAGFPSLQIVPNPFTYGLRTIRCPHELGLHHHGSDGKHSPSVPELELRAVHGNPFPIGREDLHPRHYVAGALSPGSGVHGHGSAYRARDTGEEFQTGQPLLLAETHQLCESQTSSAGLPGGMVTAA